jgi:hypothetical protein
MLDLPVLFCCCRACTLGRLALVVGKTHQTNQSDTLPKSRANSLRSSGLSFPSQSGNKNRAEVVVLNKCKD